MKFLVVVMGSIAMHFANPLPSFTQTTYLLIKSEIKQRNMPVGLSIHSIPMTSLEQCEEAGAVLIASSRFDTHNSSSDVFECIEGK